MSVADGFMDKIKDFVKGNPEQAGGAIDKVEDLVDERTGGKYSEQIDKGADTLRDQLGLPPEQSIPVPGKPAPGPTPVPEPGPTPVPEPGPTPMPEPGPTTTSDSTPAPNPEPMPDDPQQPGSIEEPMTPGGPQRPGEPGGPLEEGLRPEGGDGSTSDSPDPLPQGGPTQQGEEQSASPAPGGEQPDTGGPEKELPPFGRS